MQSKYFYIPFIGLISFLYIYLAYYTPRIHFPQFISLYLILFAAYLILLNVKYLSQNIYYLFGIGILFRLLLLFAIPHLSDDFYRFIWDGKLFLQGNSPFAHLPSEIVDFDKVLYKNLNSPNYYSVYPAVCQYIFAFSVFCFSNSLWGSVVVMRLFFILAESLSFFFLFKILQSKKQTTDWLGVYFLNPFIILELTGNLHFEGLMITFLLGTYYFVLQKKWLWVAIFFALAVNTKLLPLLLMPYFLFSFGFQIVFVIGLITFGLTLVLHIPFFTLQILQNIFKSLRLYFFTFEFNASIYYLVRWYGFQVYGYNIIQSAGKWLSILRIISITGIAWIFRKNAKDNFPQVFTYSWLSYLLLASQIHPWHITPLLAFGIFQKLVFHIVWSITDPFTYSAYSQEVYQENLWIVILEYLLVFFAILWDLRYFDYKSFFKHLK